MPDKRTPSERLRDPEALKAREAIKADTPEGRAAARRLIDLTLGGQGELTAPSQGPKLNPRLPPSQLVQDLVSFLTWKHPDAGREVTALQSLSDPRFLGKYVPGNGAMGVLEAKNGKPLSAQELKETVVHELSHAMGTNDSARMPGVIGAYDIDEASRALRPRDINLPNESPVKDVLLARQGVVRKKKR